MPLSTWNRVSEQLKFVLNFCEIYMMLKRMFNKFNVLWVNLIFVYRFRPIFIMFNFFLLTIFTAFRDAILSALRPYQTLTSIHFPPMEAHISKLKCERERDPLHCENRDSWGPTDDDEMQFESCFYFLQLNFVQPTGSK